MGSETTMPYAFIQDVPANEEMYEKIRARLGLEPPKGLITHVAYKLDPGLRYVDVWETEEDWRRFQEETLEPAVAEVLGSYGLPHDHSLVTISEIEAVDAWHGEADLS
jgi:hypothetical protein